uniref:Ig-like domain-containing protein n=1 Tax=Sparus aurata TaxID=8175 RepID=A0A671TLA9_SPAAU
ILGNCLLLLELIKTSISFQIILPCHLKPAMDVNAETIEWTRPDLEQRFVHVRRSGQDLVNIKNPSYKGRTSLFPGELKQGNISLKLCKVQLSDQGTYVCDIPLMNKKSSVRLVVALHTASVPLISISGIDRNRGGVILNCDSNSWYPEPEVFWLDGEGNLVSAGPTETVRGPDDLYTVSSRVTVERRHSNSFTCRVQQNHSNQTRETHIHVPAEVQFSITAMLFCVLSFQMISLRFSPVLILPQLDLQSDTLEVHVCNFTFL